VCIECFRLVAESSSSRMIQWLGTAPAEAGQLEGIKKKTHKFSTPASYISEIVRIAYIQNYTASISYLLSYITHGLSPLILVAPTYR